VWMTEGTKYHALFEHLLFSAGSAHPMTFSQIEDVIEAKLPPSARQREEWWSNSPAGHSQARAWMRANYKASKVDLKGETVTFVLEGWPEQYKELDAGRPGSSYSSGLAEGAQTPFDCRPEAKSSGQSGNHPLFGVWKGKVTLLPGHDYAKPAFEGGEQS
jgi:hypothetical protein